MRPLAVAITLAVVLAANVSESATAAGADALSIPAGGGLESLSVSVSPKDHVVRFTAGAAHGDVAIDLPASELSEGTHATVETIAIGGGKQIARVRVPARSDETVAWEALLAGRSTPVLWSGLTGYAHGEAGERTGEAIELVNGEGSARVVMVGEIREDLRVCGQDHTLLSTRVLDPGSLGLRGATFQRLPAAQREHAERVVASAHGGPADAPLARLLIATGASTALPGTSPNALTDGDPATVWSEGRSSDGHGEFVVMRAPGEVPIARLAVTVAPPAARADGLLAHAAAPRSFFLVAGERTLAVTLPEDAWLHPGAAYDIPLVDPLRTSCLALVLDKAYERDEEHPDVAVAELTAYSAFDAPGATLAQATKALTGGGPRGEAARSVLERAGDPGLAAIAAAYPSLDEPGRALAVDAAIGAGTCENAAPLLLAAMGDRDREVARKGREKLERCGKRAGPSLLAAMKTADPRALANAASLLASTSPREALEPLVEQLGVGSPDTRATLRAAVGKAARGAKTETLGALLASPRPAAPRLELIRALDAQLPSVAPQADGAIEAIASGSPSMATRYLLAEPLASLARGGDNAALARLVALVRKDPDDAVRAHAAEASTGVPGMTEALRDAIENDPAPRVREGALRAASGLKAPVPPGLVDAVAKRLTSEEWTFVRAAAAAALTSFPADVRVDRPLEAAITDDAATVREAAIRALAAHGDRHAEEAIRRRLLAEHEALEVRLAAVKALSALCARGSLDALTEIARRAPLPLATDEDVQVGLAAAEAIGQLHPPDLATRLAPLRAADAKPQARTAADRALSAAPMCR